MTLSLSTPYTPIPSPSDATTGLWDRRFQMIQDNVDSLNALSSASIDQLATSLGTVLAFPPSGNTVSLGTYALSASTASFSGTLSPVVSVGTLQAYSGNTVFVTSHLSMGNKRIENLGFPSAASDSANKAYVDYWATAGNVGNFVGSTFTAVASVALSDRSIAYVTSTSSLSMADSTNSLKAPVGNLWCCIGGSTASSVATFAMPGALVGGWAVSIATGSTVFLNSTGGLTATAPSAQSTIVYALGAMSSNRTLVFAPQYIASNAT